MNLIQIPTAETVTMSSLEMVDFINSQRDPREAVLAHSDFLKKVPQVLGECAGSFSGTYQVPGPKGGTRSAPCYRFPKREACLMAMSYSYDLQAKVFDRMTELEQTKKPALPDFTNPIEAARAWADQFEARLHAEKTKAQIGSRREATAMAAASVATRKVNQLLIELDKSWNYSTVKRMEIYFKGHKFSPYQLKAATLELGLPIIKVDDVNYVTVNSYPAEAWLYVYGIHLTPDGPVIAPK